MRDDDIKALVSQLRSEGIGAHEFGDRIEGSKPMGIVVKGVGFLSLWELNDPSNQTLLACRDFAAIKAKRDLHWKPAEPRLWRRVQRPK